MRIEPRDGRDRATYKLQWAKERKDYERSRRAEEGGKAAKPRLLHEIFLRRVGAFYETRPGDVKTLTRALDGYPATSFPADELDHFVGRLEQQGFVVKLIEGRGPSPLPSGREIDDAIKALPRLGSP